MSIIEVNSPTVKPQTPDQWPAWTDDLRYALTPEAWESEGHGEPGPDLGPADPADDWEDADDLRRAVYEPAPDADQADADRFTLPEWLAFVRDAFRAIGSGAALLIADAVDELASEAVILGNPTTADQFRARRDAMLASRGE